MLRRTLLSGIALPLIAPKSPLSPRPLGQGGPAGWMKPGDFGIIWGGMSANLPGVDGKNEPLIIYGDGAILKTIPNSQHYFQFPHTAKNYGYITWQTNAPYTDYSITVQVSPPDGAYWPPHYTPLPKGTGPSEADKELYQQIAEYNAFAASASAFLVIATSITPMVVVSSLTTAGFLITSFAFQLMAADPPDPNYQHFATPLSETPIIKAPAGASIGNQSFLNHLASTIGFAKATSTTINRISGAYRAKDTYWVSKQNNWYLQLKPQLLNSQNGLKAAAARWATTCVPKHAPISASTVFAAEKRWWKYGFPQYLSNAFLQLGVNQYDAEQIMIPAAPAAVANMANKSFLV